MRFLASTLFLMTFGAASAALAQQPAASPVPATAKTASAIMQPSLDTLGQTIGTLRPDKWKAAGSVREEAAANIVSIHQDLETILPPLLVAADGAPGSVAQVLPAYRNIEALYDVLLRVSEAGRLAAPGDQAAALEAARSSLEGARRTLGESVQASALTQEQQMHNLQAAVRAIPPAPTAIACPAPAPAKKRTARKKVVKKPAPAPAPANAQPSH
jgi:hypothetical protein